MTHIEAMSFWFGRVNFEMHSPKPSDLKLDRMRALLEVLGNPHQQLRIVHIAGTKGKGSTSAMLASILRHAGFRTGLFTSPHLVSVEERIQVDGEPITPDEIAMHMAELADAVQKLDEHPEHGTVTFFEVATALSFLHFLRTQTDYCVLEVGLGGRFDSTNVCDPLLAIITNISFDHMQQLGNSLAKIAREKAGIIKRGRSALSGARAPEARAVIEEVCRERAAPLRQLDGDFHYHHEPAHIGTASERLPRVQVSTWKRDWPAFELGLIGEHQAQNAAVAVAAVEHLMAEGCTIADAAVAAGLRHVNWPARVEIVGRRPLVVLDCAHNLASAEAFMETLLTSFRLPPHGKRLLIFAGSRDKDLSGMLRLLAPHFSQIYLTTFANNPRCARPHELAEHLPATACWQGCASAEAAWNEAAALAGSDDMICVTGSVFLAGELRPLMLSAARGCR